MHAGRFSAVATFLVASLLVALLTVRNRAEAQDCAGDCNEDGEVTINELVIGRLIASGEAQLDECPAADVDGNGTVSPMELEEAQADALGRCAPAPATPVPTPGRDDPPITSVNAGAIASNAGRVISLDVSLFRANNQVYATQNYLFYGAGLSFLAGEGSQPACQLVEGLDNAVAAFAFGPDGCVPGDDCDRVLAFVDASASGLPIETESLYRCQVDIDADASLGLHTITVLAPLTTDGAGMPYVTTAVNGAVVVRPPATPTPTSTPTETPTDTPSPTPSASPTLTSTHTPTEPPTPTPTNLASSCVGDCDASGTVDVSELVQGAGIALGTLPLDRCPAISQGPGEPTIEDLVLAVRNAIEGCAPAAR